MTQRYQVYKCGLCGNIVEVLHPSDGDLVCCGQKMNLLEEKNEDVGHEKQVPVIEKTENGIKIKIGSVAHPMEEKHYIEWIEAVWSGRTYIKFLKPGDSPEAEFNVPTAEVLARAYCNLHGLWKTK